MAEENLTNGNVEAGGVDQSAAPEPAAVRKKRKVRSEFFVTDEYGNDIKMKLLGYAEVRGSVYAICRPSGAPKDKAMVFRLFYAGKELCFEVVSDKKLCEEAMDEYLGSILR